MRAASRCRAVGQVLDAVATSSSRPGEQTLAPATITFLTIPTTATRRAGDRWSYQSYQSSPDSGSRMVSVAGDLAISPVRLIGFRGSLEQIATSIALAVAVQRRSARATWIGWNSSSTDFCPRWISLCIIGVGTLIERPDVDGNENRPGLVILTRIFLVELPGIEPGAPDNDRVDLCDRAVAHQGHQRAGFTGGRDCHGLQADRRRTGSLAGGQRPAPGRPGSRRSGLPQGQTARTPDRHQPTATSLTPGPGSGNGGRLKRLVCTETDRQSRTRRDRQVSGGKQRRLHPSPGGVHGGAGDVGGVRG
jgi:hypothetical protein